jgi:tRNA A-37 threonylcarbamoyl transferase component Bud32
MQADPRVGTELAGHRIEAVVGRGAMAVVYLARHLRLGRQVALKVLDRALADDEAFRDRFIRECRAVAALDHPNIVTVYDAGEAEGVLYLSMRYVEGTDLERLLETEGTLSQEVATSVVEQCAAALDAAHAEGLVHRGVVPADILLERGWEDGGRVFLADFGITKHVATTTRVTRMGSFAGTVDYVAPEQIRGESDVDARADIYSLGCVLYRCLTGEVPFPRDSELVTIYAHLEDAPPRPSDVRPDLPPAMDRVIERALAKSREDRFATCLELAGAAAHALGPTTATSGSGAEGVVAAPPREAVGATPPSGRGGRILRNAGIVAGALLLVFIGALLARSGDPDPATPSTPSPGGKPGQGVSGTNVIAAAGEIACASAPREEDLDHCRYDATAQLIHPGDLAAVLALGDNQYETGSYVDYATYYDPWWGQARSITEPVPGDREYAQGAASTPGGYFEYFGERVMGPDGLGYRSMELPSGCTPRDEDEPCWHVIALNSELCLMSGGCGPPVGGVTAGPGNKMYRWLRHDLATHRNGQYPCTLAYWHHPLFSFSSATDPSPEVQPLWDLLYGARADVVLNADAHNYQRWAPLDPQGQADARRGMREFVVGTGGAKKDSLTSEVWPSGLAAAQDTTFGILKITLADAGYLWEWVSAEGQPEYSDSITTPVSCS